MMSALVACNTPQEENIPRNLMQIHKTQSKWYYRPMQDDISLWLSIHYPENSTFNGRILIACKNERIMKTVTCREFKEVSHFVKNMHISRNRNYYIAANSVKGTKRIKDDLFALHNFVLDFDCHGEGLPHQLISEDFVALSYKDLFNTGIVPEPNSIVYTGRGVQFWWALEPASKALAFLYNRIRSWLAEQFSDLIDEYPSNLSNLEMDNAANTNIVGYYRIPNTYNTVVEKKGSHIVAHTNRFKLQDLIEHYVPDDFSIIESRKKLAERQKAKLQAKLPQVNKPVINLSGDDVKVFKGGTNALARRILQMVELRNYRNAPIGKEKRDMFCFIVYCALLSICENESDAWERLLAFNRGFKEPLEITELESTMSSAKKYRYRLTNEKIIEKLHITPEEQAILGMQSRSMKRSNYTRDLLRHKEKQSRDARILSLHNDGMSQSKIAEELQISRNTVSKVLKASKNQGDNPTESPSPLETVDTALPISECDTEMTKTQNVIDLKTAKNVKKAATPTCSKSVRMFSFVSYRDNVSPTTGNEQTMKIYSPDNIRPPT